MPKETYRMEVSANKSRREIELVTLRDGARVASIIFTVEQAVSHMKAVVAAVDEIQGKPSGLIRPN